METCSRCSKRGDPILKGARLFVGTMEVMRGKIMQCPKCNELFCGACAEVNDGFSSSYKCPNCKESLRPIG